MTDDAEDCVPLVATCRVLYHEGAKFALRKPILIFNEEQLVLFLRFLRAEDLSRCQHLRQLELWSFSKELEGIQVFIDTLPHLVNLESLRLATAEELLQHHLADSLEPALLPPLAALTNLRHLSISEANIITCSLLSSLQSPLVSFRIDFLLDDDMMLWGGIDRDGWSKYHPIMLLANFAPTLQELRCICWYTNGNDIPPENLKVYPNMRRFSIDVHGPFPLRIDPFIRAFPNLTDLHVCTDLYGVRYSGGARQLHDSNVARLLDPLDTCGVWAHLEHFSGTLVDLYSIGLISHIPRITLIDTLQDGQRADILATVLRYARPVHLQLKRITALTLGDAERGFISVLGESGMTNLSNLNLSVTFDRDDREKDLTAVMTDLFSSLGRMPLKYIELKFDLDQLDPIPEPFRKKWSTQGLPTSAVFLTLAERSLKTLDMDTLVTRMVDSLTTLETAHVVVLGSPHRGVESFERTIAKGALQMPESEQWHSC